MQKSALVLGSAALALALSFGGTALGQDIEFGDDTSTWANDGQCDDPRFEGPAAAILRSPVDEMRDATDCQTAFEAGELTLVAANEEEASEAPTAVPEDASEIDFGDDSGTWANDGECDDPRFGGALASHELADATDCRTAHEAGDVTYTPPSDATESDGEIDFGTDEGTFANDGECDDPRFDGTLTSHEMADATDCRTAYEAGEVTYTPPAEPTTDDSEIDFGDDSGVWANDGECDDPRFGGGLTDHEMADATDCRTAYDAGEVTYTPEGEQPQEPSEPIVIDGIDFGDDTGTYSNDNECDDPRFSGTGMGVALDDHLMADATDCSSAYQAGTVTLANDGDQGPDGGFHINFGDDSGASANDGVCDDPRFQGRGGALELFDVNMLTDATDCRTAYEAGTVTYQP